MIHGCGLKLCECLLLIFPDCCERYRFKRGYYANWIRNWLTAKKRTDLITVHATLNARQLSESTVLRDIVLLT